jgi:tungstate transport system substrate-binding protein
MIVRMKAIALAIAVVVAISIACRGDRASDVAPAPASVPRPVRCAVVGGMVETGMWPELVARWELATGNKVELASVGPKPVVIAAFRAGGIDLIAVHASDAMVNLVADGLAIAPQPWARNDLVIVGPADDPAGIRGNHDAVAAIAKIIGGKHKLLVHASMGADTVLHDLLDAGKLKLPAESIVTFAGDDQHEVLARAAAEHAYTIVGRIPFVDGKLAHHGLELMVRGDPRLRRPYLVELAPRAAPAARQLAAWLRSPDAQQWIAQYGKGRYDDEPLFFPVVVP